MVTCRNIFAEFKKSPIMALTFINRALTENLLKKGNALEIIKLDAWELI